MNKIIEETLRKERKRQEENIELIASEIMYPMIY